MVTLVTMEHELRKYRLSQEPKLRLDDIARAAGTTRAHVSRIEKRVRTPSLELAGKLSDATGGRVPVDAFRKAAQ